MQIIVSPRIFLVLSMLLVTQISCQEVISTIEAKNLLLKESQLPFPPAYYNTVLIYNGNIIAFAINIDDEENNDISKRTLYANIGDSVLSFFQPFDVNDCKRPIEPHLMKLLPDGRIGFLGCVKSTESQKSPFFTTPKSNESFKAMYAFDWDINKTEILINAPLSPGYSAKQYSWNPEMTRGVQEMVDGAQSTIYWISKDETDPMNLQIEIDKLSWNLSSYYNDRSYKKGNGRARSPEWSPDGQSMAFFASSYGIKEEPKLKYDIKFYLFLITPEGIPIQTIGTMTNVYSLRWSPNSEMLSFSGCVSQYNRCGLWIYKIKDDTIYSVSDGNFENIFWVSNNTILAIKNIDIPYRNNEIWEYQIQN